MCTSILPRGSLRASNPVREGHWYIREGRVVPSPKVSAVAQCIGTPLGSAQPVRDVTPGISLLRYHSEAAGLGHTSREEKSMTKADLVEQVADAAGPRVTKRECGLVVDAFLDAVKDALARGDRIELRGFGTFKVRHRKARTGRNPRTGETVEVPPRDVPVFKPSLHLRGQVDRASGVSGMKEPLKAIRER